MFSNSSTVNSNRILNTPSSFAKSSLLYLQETGTLTALDEHVSSRSGLSSYLFFMVRKGSGTLVYDGEEFKLEEGSCVFIDCEKPYSHSTSKNLWTLTWCHFNGPEMKGIYNKYLTRGGKPAFMPKESYTRIMDSLYETASSDSYVRDMKINSILSMLLTQLMTDAWNPENTHCSGKKKDIRSIRDYLDTHYDKKITLDDLSARFYIDKFYLCEQFKDLFGTTVNDYLSSVRITEAKKLLRFTDLSTDEIAEKTGINGAAYFSRIFKKIEGVTPSEYRKMW